MNEQMVRDYFADSAQAFNSYKKLAEKAMEQISDEEFFHAIDDESNSLAVIVKHIGGNLRSRWTDFLTSDGEKQDRFRDSEFVAKEDTRENLMAFWQAGWNAQLSALGSLEPADIEKTVTIRGEDYTIFRAINRSLAHTASHVGQIIFLAKHLKAKDWKTISIPRNESTKFNSFMERKDGPTIIDPLELHDKFKNLK
jgi:hypothetical protein